MKAKILIVEDQFVEADYLRLMLNKAGYVVTGIAHSVAQAKTLITEQRPDFVLLDIFLKGKLTGIDLAKELAMENIPFIYLSANSNEEVLSAAKDTQPYGFLVKPFREKDLLVTLEIAQYRHEHSVESGNRREKLLADNLSAISASTTEWQKKLSNIVRVLQPNLPFDYITAGFNRISDASAKELSFLRIGQDEYQMIGPAELLNISGMDIRELAKDSDTAGLYNEDHFETLCEASSLIRLFSKKFQLRSCLSLNIDLSDKSTFNFTFYSKKPNAYDASHTALLNNIQPILADTIDKNYHAKKTVSSPPSPEEIETEVQFDGIIGKSYLLLHVFDLVKQVAPSDTSVLILGESGTGKERIADCIHNLSPRKDQPFVKVNCAALPPTLIESELFGHEKGSFTGALDKRIGKFEKANKGTIFLDEIGEMPLELQVKLLRVLQEKYIERIGAKDPTKIDVRIIAATNRNLEKEVAEGRFRLDLYYRLNVFPIELPALHERAEDIPALAEHFITYYNRKAGKRITGISDKVLKMMTAYTWPGNIRELENLIERSVLMTKGNLIEEMFLPNNSKNQVLNDNRTKTIEENERDHIISILKQSNGKIYGPGGAAEALDVPASTLKSKMRKLGIPKN